MLLFSYLTWTRINKTIERNLLMVDSFKSLLTSNLSKTNDNDDKQSKNARPQDIVRLYDIIIQVIFFLNYLQRCFSSNDFYFKELQRFK